MVALNTAPNTPEWLSNLGAVPMKYGLDLERGCSLSHGSRYACGYI